MVIFIKKLTKMLIIIFGVWLLLALIGGSLWVYFVVAAGPATSIGITISDAVAQQLGIATNATGVEYIAAVIVNTFSIQNAGQFISQINENVKTAAIVIASVGGGILFLWMLSTIIFYAKNTKVAGVYVSKDKKEQLRDLIDMQRKTESEIAYLQSRRKA